MPEQKVKKGKRIQVDVSEDAPKIIPTSLAREFIYRLRGKYKGKGLLKALMAEKLRERNGSHASVL